MKRLDKNMVLDLLEQRVENHLDTAVSIYQNLTVKELLAAPSYGGWSIAQCLEHLNRYGKYYLPHIKKSAGNC